MTTPDPSPPVASQFSSLIVAIALRRDRDAFALLFRHFAPRLKSYLIRLGAAGELAEEIAQDALLTVWRRAESFDPGKAAASTWIFTIARNLRIDRVRRESRVAPVEDLVEIVAPQAPDELLSAAQEEVRVRAAVASLPPEQALIVRLAFFSAKPHSQIAAELALPLGTVKSRLRLAMVRLRQAMDGAT